MENRLKSTTDDSLIKPLDEREHGRSPHDDMTLRMKNRDRQRRYRARKRLEADMKRSHIISQSTPPQVETQVNGTPNACVTRIHCRRDWKKDARSAHALNKQEVKPNGPVTPDLTSDNGSETPFLPSKFNVQPLSESEIHSRTSILGNNEMRGGTPSRKHWKAEARNKKN